MFHAWILIVCVLNANAFIEEQLEVDIRLEKEHSDGNNENIFEDDINNKEYIQFGESVIISEDHVLDHRRNTNTDDIPSSTSRIQHAIIIDEIISEPTTRNKHDYYIDLHIRMKEFIDKHARRFKNKHNDNSSGDKTTHKPSKGSIGVDPVDVHDAKTNERDISSHKSERNERHGSERISHHVQVYENENSNSDSMGFTGAIIGHRIGEDVGHTNNTESAIDKGNQNSDVTANEDHIIKETKETNNEQKIHFEHHDKNHHRISTHNNKTIANSKGATHGTNRHDDDSDHRHNTKTDSDTIVGNQVSSTPRYSGYSDITKTVQVRHRGHKHKHSVTRRHKHRPHRGTKTSQQNIVSDAIHVELVTALPNTQNRESEQDIDFARNIAEISENNLSNCLCSSLCPLIILFFLSLYLRF